MLFWIVLLSVGLIAGAFWWRARKTNEGVAAGTIIRRENSIETRMFTYAVHGGSYERIWKMIDGLSLANMAIQQAQGSSKVGAITFTGGYNARLERLGMQGDADQWRFMFTHFRTRNSMVQDSMGMNVLLTSIEKGLLEIDPLTTVLEQHHSMKTHTKLI